MRHAVISALFVLLPAIPLAHAGDETPLIVGSSAQLSAQLSRLTGPAIQVETLLESASETIESSAFDRRACDIRNTAKIIIADANRTPWARFWVERLREQGVTVYYVSTEGRSTTEEQILLRLHQLIVSRFPEHRHEFDTRLNMELQRLRYASSSMTLAGSP